MKTFQITFDDGHDFHIKEVEADSEQEAREEAPALMRRQYGSIAKRWKITDITELDEEEA